MNNPAPFNSTGQSAAQSSGPVGEIKPRPGTWFFPALIIAAAVILIPLAFLLSQAPAGGGFAGEGPSAEVTCRDLIARAMQASDRSCNQTGPNQACYGNTVVNAQLLPDTLQRFSEQGDVVDIDRLVSLSAAPLDLSQQVWGIAVLRLMANMPRSLPGETVTMIVFGNTTIGSQAAGLQSFYFYSEVGQIACAELPYDGIMISMPDGAGINLRINGAELTLNGDASLKAARNDQMDVSLFRGTALIVAGGRQQGFAAGQQVSLELGGRDGTEVVGAPSDPEPLSPQDIIILCSLTGQNCPPTATPNVVARRTASPGHHGSPTAGQTTAAATPTPTPTEIPPETETPQPTATPKKTDKPTKTPKKTDVPEPSNTPVPPTEVPQPSNTPVPTDAPEPTATPKKTEKPTKTPKSD